MKKKWVAFVRGDRWVIAKVKVAQRKNALKVLSICEYGQKEAESPVPKVLQLKTWLKKNRVQLKKLEFALSCPGVITRMITLPVLSAKDLEKLLTEQVAQYFTVNIEDYLVDYRIVERIEEEGQSRLKVLVTALPKYHWEPLWWMWQEIGLDPKVVDLASDCLARLYSRLGRQAPKNNTEEVSHDLAIVDINSDGVEFLLLEHGVFFLYSDLETDLSSLLQSPKGNLQELQPIDVSDPEFAEVLRPVIRTLAEFLSFFAMRHFGKNIDKIYLTGELASLPNLPALFESQLEIPTHSGFISDWKPTHSRKVKIAENDWAKYGSLYGLALRED